MKNIKISLIVTLIVSGIIFACDKQEVEQPVLEVEASFLQEQPISDIRCEPVGGCEGGTQLYECTDDQDGPITTIEERC